MLNFRKSVREPPHLFPQFLLGMECNERYVRLMLNCRKKRPGLPRHHFPQFRFWIGFETRIVFFIREHLHREHIPIYTETSIFWFYDYQTVLPRKEV